MGVGWSFGSESVFSRPSLPPLSFQNENSDFFLFKKNKLIFQFLVKYFFFEKCVFSVIVLLRSTKVLGWPSV